MKTTLALLAAASATALLGGCAVYPAPYGYGGAYGSADVYYQSAPAPVYVAPPPVYWRSAPPAYRYDGRGPGWGRRDSDRDGVPNRFDRDRDGDGVPNRRDARPNDPRRY